MYVSSLLWCQHQTRTIIMITENQRFLGKISPYFSSNFFQFFPWYNFSRQASPSLITSWHQRRQASGSGPFFDVWLQICLQGLKGVKKKREGRGRQQIDWQALSSFQGRKHLLGREEEQEEEGNGRWLNFWGLEERVRRRRRSQRKKIPLPFTLILQGINES